MDFFRKNLCANYKKGSIHYTITMDDDFNVPDAKPDIGSKLTERGEILLDKVGAGNGKANAKGSLCYRFLYRTEQGDCNCMEGKISFEELIPFDSMEESDLIRCVPTLEDLTIRIIHSRKISVKAVVSLQLHVFGQEEKDVLHDCAVPDCEYRYQTIRRKKLLFAQKDIYRIRDSISLNSSMPNIEEIIWQEISVDRLDFLACNGGVQIKGELDVFALYRDDADDEGNYSYQGKLPFSGNLSIQNCQENTVLEPFIESVEKILTAQKDDGGEVRVLEAEIVLHLDLWGYEEEEQEILADIYAPAYELTPKTQTLLFDTLGVMKNVTCQIQKNAALPDAKPIRILNCSGVAGIEEVRWEPDEKKITLEGAAKVSVLYESGAETTQIGCMEQSIPMKEQYSLPNLPDDCDPIVLPGGERFTARSDGMQELTVQANLDYLLAASAKHETTVITEIECEEKDPAALNRRPDIVGYIVKEQDTLWDIAKRFDTTRQNIMECNHLTSEEVTKGTRLLIIKK